MQPLVVLLRQPRDSAQSCELLEMLAALAVFALPLTLVAMDSPDRLLATEDAEVQALLEQLPGFGDVRLLGTVADNHGRFAPMSTAELTALLSGSNRVLGV